MQTFNTLILSHTCHVLCVMYLTFAVNVSYKQLKTKISNGVPLYLVHR